MKRFRNEDVKNKIFIASEIVCAVFSLLGVLLSLLYYARDGYFHWSRRLLYYTAQSNLWLSLSLFICFFLKLKSNLTKQSKSVLFLIKYVYTVSITVTGLVFCTLLAPLAPKSYNVWSLSGIVTHVFTPILAIISLFFTPPACKIEKKHCFIAMLPSLLYFIVVLILSVLSFDFGRGDKFVYFFLDFTSFSSIWRVNLNSSPPLLGSFYWLIILLLTILSIALLLRKLVNKQPKYLLFKNERI